MSVQQQKFKEIADAIREKTGSTELIKPSAFAAKVGEVYETGKEAERREFWEALTSNGAKEKYYYTFSENKWNGDNFNPTCDIVPTEADHMFYRHNYNGEAYDLAKRFEDNGCRLDFSNCTLGNYTFESAVVSRLPEINNAKGTFTCFVRNCKSLVTIDKIVCSDAGEQNFTQTFNYCRALENITFEGVIGRSISFPNSPLSVASMKNIISTLKNYAGTDYEFTYALTLKSSCWAALDAEGATAPGGINWRTYAENKGWITD